jgi:hypothetical protein
VYHILPLLERRLGMYLKSKVKTLPSTSYSPKLHFSTKPKSYITIFNTHTHVLCAVTSREEILNVVFLPPECHHKSFVKCTYECK